MSMTTPRKSRNDRGQNIQVFVRVRPLNSSEKSQRSCSVVDTPGSREVVVKEKPTSSITKTFHFDRVFGPDSKQSDVYKSVVGPLINQVMQGYNCTVFAYGQTGTGKTYTMEGNPASEIPIEKDPDSGIIPRALNALFDGLRTGDATEWSVRVSFLELYNEEIFDLLSGNDDQSRLRLYEDGMRKGSVIIQGLEEVQVHSKQEVYRILERGSEKRRTAETKMNANSSRSHTVFTVTVFINQQSIDGDDMLKIGKLNLVDLAGSENIGRSGAVDKRAREAGQINQSLLTLGRVITCLVEKAPHVPYRESKLTRLLQDSLGGRTKTSIIATVSPASINLEETLSTLDYAHRAKNIQNKPEVNQKISKKEKLLEYHAEIDKLKSELQAARDKDGVFLPKDVYDEQVKEKLSAEAEIKDKTLQLKAIEEELEKFKEIIAETTARLEETTAQRDQTQRALDCTRTVLHKTEGDRAEQAHLVARHIDTESKLSQQAQILLTVSDEATKDLKKLHDKLDRKKLVETSNEETLGQFRRSQVDHLAKLDHMITDHVEAQNELCNQHQADIDVHADRRATERSQLTSKYAETVSKLIRTMGDIDRATSEQMGSEQSWADQLLKRVKAEADVATNDFHGYLVDQLLVVSSKILTALQKQDKSVQELSSKLDKNFAGITEKLETYIAQQSSLRAEKAKVETDLFSGLSQRNSELTKTFGDDIKATEEYIRKSKAFDDQIMSLISARAKEEELFLADRKATVNNAMSLTSASEEAISVTEERCQELAESVANVENQLEANYGEIMLTMKSEKAIAVEAINKSSEEAAKATDSLRSDADAFAKRGKDHWAEHCAKTETSLKEMNQLSSRHASSIQIMTSNAQKEILGSQASVEKTLQNWSAEEEEANRSAHTLANSQISELNAFGSRLKEEVKTTGQAVSNLVEKQIKKDVPTGQTPGRVNRAFPKEIHQGTPEDIRKRRFRQQWNASGLASKIDMDFEASDPDLLDENDETPSDGSHDDSRDSVFSGSKFGSGSLSRQDSGGKLPARGIKASSKSNLSEASSIDTGILGDIDNKENFNQDQFQKPQHRPSKLRAPESVSSRSRSSSRTRQQSRMGSVN